MIPPALTNDWNSQSVCIFMQDYVISSDQSATGIGYLHGLPDLWVKQEEFSSIRQAVSAVALTSLAHRSSSLDYLLPQARRQYGQALMLTLRALSNPAEWKQDSTLATVLLLGVYEVRAIPTSMTLAHVLEPLCRSLVARCPRGQSGLHISTF